MIRPDCALQNPERRIEHHHFLLTSTSEMSALNLVDNRSSLAAGQDRGTSFDLDALLVRYGSNCMAEVSQHPLDPANQVQSQKMTALRAKL